MQPVHRRKAKPKLNENQTRERNCNTDAQNKTTLRTRNKKKFTNTSQKRAGRLKNTNCRKLTQGHKRSRVSSNSMSFCNIVFFVFLILPVLLCILSSSRISYVSLVVQCSVAFYLFILFSFFFFVIKVVVVNFVMFVCFDLYVVCTIPVKRK